MVEVEMPVVLAAVTVNTNAPSGEAVTVVDGALQVKIAPPSVQVVTAVGSLTVNPNVTLVLAIEEPSVGPEVIVITGAFGPVEVEPPVGKTVAGFTKNELVATRPLVLPMAVICEAPLWSEFAIRFFVNAPLASAVMVEVAPSKPTSTGSNAQKFVPTAVNAVPGVPLKSGLVLDELVSVRKACVEEALPEDVVEA